MLVLLFISISEVVNAQSVLSNDSSIYDQYNTGAAEQQMGMEEEVDSLSRGKKERVVKPMLSYLFTDSTRVQNVFSWRHSTMNNNVKIAEIDTALVDFHRDYRFFQNESVGAIYLGNLGGAETQLNYFDRANMQNFSFLSAYADYLMTPENVQFYNGKNPFTQLSFFMSGQTARAEEQLRVIHAQNISPSTSIVLDYRNNGTRGMYNYQSAKSKNLNLSVAHTGKKLTIHGGYIYNMGSVNENGGLVDAGMVKDTLVDLPQTLEMNLEDAYNSYKGNTFYATASYAIPFIETGSTETIANVPALFVGTSVQYTKYHKQYSDTKSGVYEDYYQNWYINPDRTTDSLAENLLDAKAFMQLQPYNREGILGTIDGGIGYRNYHYYNFSLSDYLYPQDGFNESSVYVFGNIGGKLKRYVDWNGGVEYTPIGYRNQDIKMYGDLKLNAFVKNKPLSLSGSVQYEVKEPSYWSEHYFSNHYMWNNSFDKENETRFSVKLEVPDVGIEASMTQSVVTNKIYYNAESLPTQYGSALSVTGVYLRKDFRLGGFHFNNRVLLQWSSNQEVAPVPLASVNLNYYFEFNVVKNVLRMQIGADGYYNTEYYGYAYNPAIMQFYNQQSVKVGNYPWTDLYISGKWKRLRFLVKLQHFNNELYGGRDYFSVVDYPLNRRMLKMGVSWNFYD